MISVEVALERLKDKAILLDVSTYVGWKKKARFVDPEFGEWFTLPKYVAEGHEHPKRGRLKCGQATKISLEEILRRLGDKASWLDQNTFVSYSEKATFNHPEFGKWVTNISTVIAGHDHPKVGKRNRDALCMVKYGRVINCVNPIKEDLVGKTFGRYTVIALHSHSPVRWLVRCICGTENTQTTSKIKSAQSCGCFGKESARSRSITFNQSFIGNVYSKWTVIGIADRPTYLQCQCECGTIREVYRNSLFDGVSTNCGCVATFFKTEEQCRSILEQLSGHKWPKKRLFKNPETNTHLELDGYCDALKMAFEYDGEQHFKKSYFDKGDGGLKDRQRRDAIKDRLCLELGVKLIRIPYTMKKDLDNFIKDSLQKAINERH